MRENLNLGELNVLKLNFFQLCRQLNWKVVSLSARPTEIIQGSLFLVLLLHVMMVKQMAPTNTNRTRLGKRKQEMQELRKEKQTITSKKHDKTCLEKDNSKDNSKSQLMVLQEQFDALKIEYEKQLETVHLLETKVKDLEKERTNYQPNVVKTDKGDILMLCCECEYPAEDIFDLGEHMYEAHSQNEESEISCELCGDTFSTEESLREHKIKMHKN